MARSLHPNLRLLLKRIGIIEKMTVSELLAVIEARRRMPMETAISLFCANYFAQATTLQGHEAAGHGQGQTTVKIVTEAFQSNDKAYDLAVTQKNDYRLSSSKTQSGRTQ